MYAICLVLNYAVCLVAAWVLWRRFVDKSEPYHLFFEAFVAGNLFYCIEAWFFAEGLSLVNALKTPEPMVGLHAASLLLLAAVVWSYRETLMEAVADLRSAPRDSFAVKILLAAVLLIFLPLCFIAVIYPPCTADSMSYHLPRIMHWIQNGNLEMYPTNYPRQLFYQPFPEYLILPWEQVLQDDYVDNLIQCIALLVLLVQLVLLVRFFNGNVSCQLLAVGLALASPIVIFEAPTTQTDIILTALYFSFVYFGMKLSRSNPEPTSTQLLVYSICLGSSLGLSLNTKLSIGTFEIPFCLWFGWRYLQIYYRSDRPLREDKALRIFAIMVAGFLLFNGPYFSRNAAITGGIFGPSEIQMKMRNLRFGVGPTFSNALRNIAMQLRVPSNEINELNRDFVFMVHEKLHLSMKDPATTYCGDGEEPYDYETIFVLDDYRAGNSLIILLGLITGGATLLAAGKRFFTGGESVASPSPFRQKEGKRENGSSSPLTKTADNNDISLGFYAVLTILGFLVFSGIFRWQPFGARLLLPPFLGIIPFIAIKMDALLPRERIALLAMVVYAVGMLYTIFLVATSMFFDPTYTLLVAKPPRSEREIAMYRQAGIEQWKLRFPENIISGTVESLPLGSAPNATSPQVPDVGTAPVSQPSPSAEEGEKKSSPSEGAAPTSPAPEKVESDSGPESTPVADAPPPYKPTLNEEMWSDYFISKGSFWETIKFQRKYKYFRLIQIYLFEYLAISNQIKELGAKNVGLAMDRFYDRWEYPFWPLLREDGKTPRIEWVVFHKYLENSVNFDPAFVPDVIITDYSPNVIEKYFDVENAWIYEHLVLVQVKGKKGATPPQAMGGEPPQDPAPVPR